MRPGAKKKIRDKKQKTQFKEARISSLKLTWGFSGAGCRCEARELGTARSKPPCHTPGRTHPPGGMCFPERLAPHPRGEGTVVSDAVIPFQLELILQHRKNFIIFNHKNNTGSSFKKLQK